MRNVVGWPSFRNASHFDENHFCVAVRTEFEDPDPTSVVFVLTLPQTETTARQTMGWSRRGHGCA